MLEKNMTKIQLFWLRIKSVVDSLKKQAEETEKKAKAGILRRGRHSDKELQDELKDFIASGSFRIVSNSTNEDIVVKDAFGKRIVIKPGEEKKINWIGRAI